MDSASQPVGIEIEEPMPNPPVAAQPIALPLAEDFSVSYFRSPDTGVSSVQISGPLRQPRGSTNQSVRQGRNIPVGLGSENPIEQVLALHEKLSFRTFQKLSYGAGSIIVQIRGSDNQIVMSTMMRTTIKTVHADRDNIREEWKSTITFNDPTGKILMTCKQSTREFTVTTGDRFLGIIKGVPLGCGCCWSTLSVQGVNGDILFEVVNHSSAFRFVANEITIIATAKKGIVHGNDFGVEFSASMDPNIRAMIVAVSYYLYVLHHAETVCGCSGSLNLRRLMFGIVATIVVLVITISAVAS